MVMITLMIWQLANADRLAPQLGFSVIEHCPRDTISSDVVVCGRVDPDRYRLKPLPQRYVKKDDPPLAQVKLLGGVLSGSAEQGGVGGIATNRAMVKLKIPF